MLIAATTMEHQLLLATRNVRCFFGLWRKNRQPV